MMMGEPTWTPKWMDEGDWINLRAAGWTAEIMDLAKPTPQTEAIEKGFLVRAQSALEAIGFRAMEFLSANPDASKISLAKRLNRGVNAVGLIMAVYQDAKEQGLLRECAKDLLVRTIKADFPQGWICNENEESGVKLGSWCFDVFRSVDDKQIIGYAKCIVRSLNVDEPPPEGWKPDGSNDPYIDELFAKCWPVST